MGLRAITYSGQLLHIHAGQVVLAMGGIESVRLLLLSGGGNHPTGLGNDHDQLGRYFMDHPQAHLGMITPKNRDIFEHAALYDLHWHPEGGYASMGVLKFSETARQRDKLYSYAFILYPRRRTHLSSTFQAYRAYAQALNRRYIPPNPVGNLTEMVRNPATMLRIAGWKLTRQNHYNTLRQGGWSHLKNKARIFDVFEVITLIEQPPRSENRITLGESTDAYGQRRVRIHWHWLPEDTQQVRRSQDAFASAVARSGFGEATFPNVPYHVPGSHHHMGGARLNDDPRRGVVDANCKVHGIDGLYVASSAVFPTGGFSNPTLTIVALATRLADHLKQVEKRHAELIVTVMTIFVFIFRLLQTHPSFHA
jgi:choline dehydrogenase-like flavoprotein